MEQKHIEYENGLVKNHKEKWGRKEIQEDGLHPAHSKRLSNIAKRGEHDE